MYFMVAPILALATSTVADTPTALPYQLLVNRITAATATMTTTTTVAENVTIDPTLISFYSSLWGEKPTDPPELTSWFSSVEATSAYNLCDMPSSAIPTSLSSAYAAYESSATKWYSEMAAGLGSLQSVDRHGVDDTYSAYMWILDRCDSYKTMFSSVFYAAASATATTTSATSIGKDTKSTVSGASSTWKGGILGAALIGMLGFVALL